MKRQHYTLGVLFLQTSKSSRYQCSASHFCWNGIRLLWFPFFQFHQCSDHLLNHHFACMHLIFHPRLFLPSHSPKSFLFPSHQWFDCTSIPTSIFFTSFSLCLLYSAFTTVSSSPLLFFAFPLCVKQLFRP